MRQGLWFVPLFGLAAILYVICRPLAAADNAQQISFFSSALLQAHATERVVLYGKTYDVTGGAVSYNGGSVGADATLRALQLAYEKSVARRSPLIALPGVDPEKMLSGVGDLRETARLLAQTQTRARDSAIVQASLYPIDFLTSAALLEQARLDFLESGSATDAARYESALRQASRTYRRDISAFRAAFIAIVPEDIGRYATQKSIVSRDGVLRALQILDSGMARTEVLVSKRLSCFRGDIAACDSADIQLPTLEIPARETHEIGALRLAQDVRTMLSSSGYALDPLSDPLVQLSESSCIVAQSGTSLLFTFRTQSSLGKSFLIPIFTGDIVLIPTNTYSTTAFYSYFSRRDFPYVPQGSLSYYVCEASDRDLGELVAIRDIRTFALQEHLSAYASGDNKRALEVLEATALNGPILKHSDIIAYLNAAHSLISLNILPASTSNKIISLWLEMRDRSIGLYQTILSINLFERSNLHLSNEGVPLPLEITYLFFARSGFAQLFMEGNPSATGHYGSLFDSNQMSADQLPYVYYSSLENATGTRSAIVRGMTFYRTLHETGNQ